MRGKIGFQVPQDATGLVFVFDADIFGIGKVFVDLGPSPIAVEPPAQLAGELEQEMFAIGDIVEMGDMILIVNEVIYPAGSEFSKPDPGNMFVAVDLTLENRGAEAKAVSSLIQMYLKDSSVVHPFFWTLFRYRICDATAAATGTRYTAQALDSRSLNVSEFRCNSPSFLQPQRTTLRGSAHPEVVIYFPS